FLTRLVALSLLRTGRPARGGVVGSVVGFTGVAFLAGAGLTNLGSASGQGVLALLASSACYGVGFAYARRYVRGEPLAISATQISIAAILLAPVALLFGDVASTNLTPANAAAWITLGLIPTGVAYILYYRLIAGIGAT